MWTTWNKKHVGNAVSKSVHVFGPQPDGGLKELCHENVAASMWTLLHHWCVHEPSLSANIVVAFTKQKLSGGKPAS